MRSLCTRLSFESIFLNYLFYINLKKILFAGMSFARRKSEIDTPLTLSREKKMKRLLLVLIAFVALCAAAAPVSAQDCEVVLKGKSSQDKWYSIRTSKAYYPLGFADSFTPGDHYWDEWKKETGRDFGQYSEWDRTDWDNEIEVVEFHGSDCNDAQVMLFEHPDYDGWVETVMPYNPVIPNERKEKASSFAIIFRNNYNLYTGHYGLDSSVPPEEVFMHHEKRAATQNISIGADGSVWRVDMGDRVWHLNQTTGMWIPNGGQGTHIAVSADGLPWLVASDNSVWRYDLNAGGFVDVPGGLLDIAFGADNSVFGIGLDNLTYKWNSPANAFKPFGNGEGTDIAVDPQGNPWVIGHNHTVWRYDPHAGGFLEVPAKIF